jgi:exodeoxyribonuclease VII large subunit
MPMDIPSFMDHVQILAVSELASRIKEALTSDPGLQHIAVKGEVSNYTKSHAGHIYFSIKDSGATIRCVAFRSRAERLSYTPTGGDEVIIFGSVDIYPQGGTYQIFIEEIFRAGRGELFAKYLELKDTLEKEGLFEPSRKKIIPMFPSRIGVVTSPKGAAVRDILKILSRRAPHIEVVISPSVVQGNEAPSRIIESLEKLLKIYPMPDIVILARGGGSFEDLFCFNDEQLARYISDYPLPIVTGVGHETDFTLVDFVSDHRSPTPTAAAHDSVPNRDLLRDEVRILAERWQGYIRDGINDYRDLITQTMEKPVFMNPERRWNMFYQEIDQINSRMYRSVAHKLRYSKSQVQNIISILEQTNPLNLLDKGYAIVLRSSDDKLVRTSADIHAGDDVNVKLGKGSFIAMVKTTEIDNG